MSINDFANNLELCASQLQPLLADIYERALIKLDAEINHRIFDLHEDINGQKIGSYSSEPMLVGAKSFKNKTNADKFFKSEEAYTDDTQGFRTLKSGKKAFLLPGGYKKLRIIQGLQSKEVDFKYTSELLRNGIVRKIQGDKYQLLFNNKENEVKIRGYEKKKGKKIAYQSESEEKMVLMYIGDELYKGVKSCLNL